MAARLGVADFVYTAAPVAKGSALREAGGDGLLISNGLGAVLQVKSRDPKRALDDDRNRVETWIRKNALRARDQGRGTRRELVRRANHGTPLRAYPVRAAHLPEPQRERYALEVRSDTTSWPIIVVLDHRHAEGIDLAFEPDTFWTTYDDWCELQLRVRSTTGLLNYVRRVLSDQLHVPLGHELERYAGLRAADERASAGNSLSPYLSDATRFDSLGTDLFHDVIDKVWYDDGEIPWTAPEEYRFIVEFLDAVPPQAQSVIGRWFLRKRAELASGQRIASGLTRLSADRLVYACSERRHWENPREWLAEFSLLTTLRHVQSLETGAKRGTTTLGVAALVEERAGRSGVSYLFVLLKGTPIDNPIPPDLRRRFEWLYGIHDHDASVPRELKVGRNESCPCLSGKKFKRCCG